MLIAGDIACGHWVVGDTTGNIDRLNVIKARTYTSGSHRSIDPLDFSHFCAKLAKWRGRCSIFGFIINHLDVYYDPTHPDSIPRTTYMTWWELDSITRKLFLYGVEGEAN